MTEVRQVIERLHEGNLQKCLFIREEIPYLLWKVEGPLHSPNGTLVNLNKVWAALCHIPVTVVLIVLRHTALGQKQLCTGQEIFTPVNCL